MLLLLLLPSIVYLQSTLMLIMYSLYRAFDMFVSDSQLPKYLTKFS